MGELCVLDIKEEKKRLHAEMRHRSYKKHYEKNKEKFKNRSLLYNYGITPEEYNKIFETQKGNCAICGKHQTKARKGLHIDHCHTSGKIRGLLCMNCNTALGHLKESPDILQSCIDYLNKYK